MQDSSRWLGDEARLEVVRELGRVGRGRCDDLAIRLEDVPLQIMSMVGSAAYRL